MRDDFSDKTKQILAKRVGFLCSNPKCENPTVGPNSDGDKFTNIGIAAHITAASIGGARYNKNLSSSERQNIENGIWLCSNCASLIDRDQVTFTVELLRDWKGSAEKKMFEAISGRRKDLSPFLEADIVWNSLSREPHGLSSKNLEIYEQPISAGTDLYQYWTLKWRLKLVIYNNSEIPSYNVEVLESGGVYFDFLEKPSRINNISPFGNIELEAIYSKSFHGTSQEADEELTDIPKDFTDKILEIKYYDNERDEFRTEVKFSLEKLSNKKI